MEQKKRRKIIKSTSNLKHAMAKYQTDIYKEVCISLLENNVKILTALTSSLSDKQKINVIKLYMSEDLELSNLGNILINTMKEENNGKKQK